MELHLRGLPVGPRLSYQLADLPPGTLATLAGAEAIDLVAPKLLELTAGPRGEETLVVGVEWGPERQMRAYWRARGSYPQRDREVLLGARHPGVGAAGHGDGLQGAT